MSKKRLAVVTVRRVIAGILLVVIFACCSTPTPSDGLNTIGGIYLVYQADLSQVPVDSQAQVMAQVRDVVEERISSWGISEPTVQIGMQEGYYGVSIQLPGVTNITAAKNIIGRTGLLDFREQLVEGGNTTWVIAKAIGSNGTEEELTGKYLKPDASVHINPLTDKPAVSFEWNAEGAILFEQITARNLNKPLGIFLDNELIYAPTVEAVIKNKVVLEGDFSLDEAKTLAIQLNSGALPASLGRWVEQGNSTVFEASVPLHEELVTPP